MTPAQPFAAILILAAGQSQRMRGADKMLEVVRGLPLIRRQAQTALATGLPVSVALTPTQPLRAAALADLPITVVQVTDAENGISRSIVAGNAAIHPDLGLVLLLADLPDIETADLISLLDAARRAR